MDRSKWFFHPIFVFIFSIIALCTSLFLYIYWYMEVSIGLRSLVSKFNLDANQVLESETWLVILVLSILVAIILVGIFTIFVYNQKMYQLYRLQNNFINNFTHELKTPVTSLKLYLETFLKHELPRNQQVKYLEYMLHDASRLTDNINRILNLGRIENKRIKDEFISTNLVYITDEIILSRTHSFPNMHIRLDYPEYGDYTYPINRQLFEMLVINIISNAAKYNASNRPNLVISFCMKKKYMTISFRDNGIGIEKNEQRKIFKKFYQIGRSDDMSAKGSGLGLYMAQQIAKIHGGRIIAYSQGKDMGSTFTLIFPRSRQKPL